MKGGETENWVSFNPLSRKLHFEKKCNVEKCRRKVKRNQQSFLPSFDDTLKQSVICGK